MKYVISIFVAFLFAQATPLFAQTDEVTIFLFGRDDCTHCKAEKDFLNEYVQNADGVRYEYHNVITNDTAKQNFEKLIEKHELTYVTPLTVIGGEVIQGFNAPETTGVKISDAVTRARTSDIRTLEDHFARAPKQSDVSTDAGCDKDGKKCGGITNPNAFVFKLPLIGIVDLKTFSLFTLSALLGVVDGFNPCAMWVLITFLILLSQIGDKRKMMLVAGIFIVAEAIMYNLILNVWFTTWDFVGLDALVTPLVGILAVGGGLFFLYRYRKNRNKPLVCDITDIDTQYSTTQKIQDLITKPTTIFTILGIIAIAFSVNIIEFACSIGVPQAYTKILELNNLDFITRQFYILIYTLGYMVDDVVVFGLAIWGFSKLEAHGHKYAQLSLLIGGILMLVLGAILVLNPSLLVL
jgi:cytochrome c biogenesis protein CcdA/glutaredoxin